MGPFHPAPRGEEGKVKDTRETATFLGVNVGKTELEKPMGRTRPSRASKSRGRIQRPRPRITYARVTVPIPKKWGGTDLDKVSRPGQMREVTLLRPIGSIPA